MENTTTEVKKNCADCGKPSKQFYRCFDCKKKYDETKPERQSNLSEAPRGNTWNGSPQQIRSMAISYAKDIAVQDSAATGKPVSVTTMFAVADEVTNWIETRKRKP